MQTTTSVHQVGRYLVTPLTKATEEGRYAASVSIRRGMHDRVFRFIPLFDSAPGAAVYALAQGQALARGEPLC